MLVNNNNVTTTAPENGMEIVTLQIEDLNLSPLNPSSRTKPKKLQKLKNNLAKYGQLTPIIVKKMQTTTPDTSMKHNIKSHMVLRVVDGHRRTHCLSELGHDTIKALIVKNEANFDETFTALHADTMKISSVQECERWLKGAKFISNAVVTIIKELQEKLGKATARQVIIRCVVAEMSPGSLNKCLTKFRVYTGKSSRISNKAVAYWVLNISKPWRMVRAIDSFIPVGLLLECIDNKVPIPDDWAVRD